MSTQEWFEKFFTGLYGQVLAGQFRPERTLWQARLIKRLLKVRKGQRVLDCPCGQGRLTIPLAKLGLEMTGVDLTKPFIRRARQEARCRRAKVTFIHRDMRKIDFDGEFDAVVNWFSSFGYFSDRDNLAFCRRVLRALKPGGQFMIELLNQSYLLRHLHGGYDEVVSGVRIQNRPRWNAETSRIRDVWTMSQGRHRERRELLMRVYTGGEIRQLLRQAGFTDIRLYEHNRRGVARMTRHSRRFIVLARKPIPAHLLVG